MKSSQMKVSINDIIDLLPIVADRGWTARAGSSTRLIRSGDGECPICALLNEINWHSWPLGNCWTTAAYSACNESGISICGIDKIVNAADTNRKSSSALRRRILEALGVQP